MKLTLEVIEAVEVIHEYLKSKGYHTLRVSNLGGVTVKLALGSHVDYLSPMMVNFQKDKLQHERSIGQ